MDVYQAIEKRCSVRSYLRKPVEEDKLNRVLEAGRLSPSARNDQERKFIVVRDASKRAQLADAAGQAFIGDAPVIIAVVSTNPGRILHCGVPAGPVDCAIAIDHMTLAATAEGLGTCWIGHFEQDACRKILGVPPVAQIIELLTLGYSGKQSDKPKSRRPAEEVICYETYRE